MGFGLKTDYATGRTLDLDKTYRQIIKPAVENAGLECIRADDIIHAGVIDKPMYELLLQADVVVADLSTSNVNAVYELGVRHALKPNTTIIIAEKQFKFPFDIGHIAIRMYEHMGNGIKETEAKRMRKSLTEAIEYLAERNDTNSPVNTFLPGLNTPSLGNTAATGKPPQEVAVVPEPVKLPAKKLSTDTPTEDDEANSKLIAALLQEAREQQNWELVMNLSTQLLNKRPEEIFVNSILLDLFMAARKAENWQQCISLLNKLLTRRVGDVYLMQQLALATYKGKQPDLPKALQAAKLILEQLNPYQTTDPETLGLWGAVHKRLWELTNKRVYLDESLMAYEKGFILKNDFYNGINFAYLLNVRASISKPREALSDVVHAERVRLKVIEFCHAIINKKALAKYPIEFIENEEQKFWVQATLVEAYLGTGQVKQAEALRKKLSKTGPENWMLQTMDDQLGKLSKLLKTTRTGR